MEDPIDFRQLILMLTDRCNLRCAYCFQTRRSGRRMTRATVRAAVDLACRSSQPQVRLVFTGGEPLLEFAAVRWAIAYAESAEKMFTYGLITNGIRLTPAVQDFLAAHDVQVQLSFDGAEGARDLRGTGTFQLLHRRLTGLHERHPGFFDRRLRVAITLTPATVPSLSASIGYLLSQGIQEIDLATSVTGPGTCPAGCEAELRRQLDAIYRMMINHRRRTGRIPLRCMQPSSGAGRSASTSRDARGGSARDDAPMCGFTHAVSPTVDPAGRVYACAAIVDSVQELDGPLFEKLREACFGDVRAPELPRRLWSFRHRAARFELFGGRPLKHGRGGLCTDCRYQSGCAICPVAIGHIPGNQDPHRVPEFACTFNRIMGSYRARLAVARAESATLQDVASPDPARIPTSLTSLRAFAARRHDKRARGSRKVS